MQLSGNKRATGPHRSTIVLTGFMGTGKTTVGHLLAERLGLPFHDVDARVEAREGCSVAEIFSRHGEPYFRQCEREELARALAEGGVVATGGGAIADPENLRQMRMAGPVLCLTASVDEIVARTAGSPERPLLQADDVRQRIVQLLEQRAQAYAQADAWIDTTGKSPEEVVDEILAYLGLAGEELEELGS